VEVFKGMKERGFMVRLDVQLGKPIEEVKV
jgi:hypothetical protein